MNNPMMMFQAIKNPQEFLNKMMGNPQVTQNPMLRNAMDMYQKGDSKGLEELGRNLCKEKGINPEEAMKNIKSYFGM